MASYLLEGVRFLHHLQTFFWLISRLVRHLHRIHYWRKSPQCCVVQYLLYQPSATLQITFFKKEVSFTIIPVYCRHTIQSKCTHSLEYKEIDNMYCMCTHAYALNIMYYVYMQSAEVPYTVRKFYVIYGFEILSSELIQQ